MRNYLAAVTLGAFTRRDGQRVAGLLRYSRKAGTGWQALHFVLLSVCANFPIAIAVARLSPFDLFARLYGEDFLFERSEFAEIAGELGPAAGAEGFNALMRESAYGWSVLLPLLAAALALVIVIQAVFYLSAVFFLRLSRMNVAPLPFRDRMGLALYSSTLPALLSALFGIFLPTVHLLVFYFAVIFIIFQRSALCPDG